MTDRTRTPTVVKLPVFGIVITDLGSIATFTHEIVSDDPPAEGEDEKLFDATINGIITLVLAHYQAGIDVTSPAYLEGIESAVENSIQRVLATMTLEVLAKQGKTN